jgi:hypothetical protein
MLVFWHFPLNDLAVTDFTVPEEDVDVMNEGGERPMTGE